MSQEARPPTLRRSVIARSFRGLPIFVLLWMLVNQLSDAGNYGILGLCLTWASMGKLDAWFSFRGLPIFVRLWMIVNQLSDAGNYGFLGIWFTRASMGKLDAWFSFA